MIGLPKRIGFTKQGPISTVITGLSTTYPLLAHSFASFYPQFSGRRRRYSEFSSSNKKSRLAINASLPHD